MRLATAIGLIAVLALTACESDHPATQAGAAIDRAGTATGNAVGRAATDTGSALNRAATSTGSALDRAGTYVDRKLNGPNGSSTDSTQ